MFPDFTFCQKGLKKRHVLVLCGPKIGFLQQMSISQPFFVWILSSRTWYIPYVHWKIPTIASIWYIYLIPKRCSARRWHKTRHFNSVLVEAKQRAGLKIQQLQQPLVHNSIVLKKCKTDGCLCFLCLILFQQALSKKSKNIQH